MNLCEDNRGGSLILECNTQSKLIRKRMETEQEDNKYITCLGNYALTINDVLRDRRVKEMIRSLMTTTIAETLMEAWRNRGASLWTPMMHTKKKRVISQSAQRRNAILLMRQKP